MKMMTPSKQILISNIHKKLGFEDPDLTQLIEVILNDDIKFSEFKESVFDTVSEYHNNKKELISVIEDLVTVLSAAREYDNDRTAYSEKQRKLLWDTGSEALIKALKVLNKN